MSMRVTARSDRKNRKHGKRLMQDKVIGGAAAALGAANEDVMFDQVMDITRGGVLR